MATPVEGPENPGSAIVRPPVRTAAAYRSTKPTYTDGQLAELQAGTRGSLLAQIVQADGTVAIGSLYGSAGGGDGRNDTGLVAAAYGLLFNGTSFDRARTPNVFKTVAAVAVTAGTPQTVWTPGAGKKFRLLGFMLSLTVAGSVILKDSGSELIRTGLLAAGVGIASPPMGNGILSALANNVLQVDASATGSVSGYVFGTEE
jgi:hypothetical protein